MLPLPDDIQRFPVLTVTDVFGLALAYSPNLFFPLAVFSLYIS